MKSTFLSLFSSVLLLVFPVVVFHIAFGSFGLNPTFTFVCLCLSFLCLTSHLWSLFLALGSFHFPAFCEPEQGWAEDRQGSTGRSLGDSQWILEDFLLPMLEQQQQQYDRPSPWNYTAYIEEAQPGMGCSVKNLGALSKAAIQIPELRSVRF